MSVERVEIGSNGWFVGALTIVFIVLKLVGVIAWSWWWVLSPLWIPVAVVLLILAISGIIAWWLER